MKTKDVLLKIICPCIVAIIFAIIGLVIFLPKQKEETLFIDSNDMTIHVNEESNLKFYVSNPYAVVTFDIENDNIVSSNGFKLKGLKEGTTTIDLFAKYNEDIATCECKITVIDNESNLPDIDDGNDDQSSTETPQPPDETEEPETPTSPEEPTQPPEENNLINFEIFNQSGCEIEETTITVSKGKNCYFRLSSDEFENWGDCTFKTNQDITISELTAGFNSWKIVANENGTIEIIYQNKTIGIITIIIK